MSLILLFKSSGTPPPPAPAVTGSRARTGGRHMHVSNALRIQITSGSEPELDRAEDIVFDTIYPAGLFGSAAFNVRRDAAKPWALRGHQGIRITNGMETVWEGEIASLVYMPGVGFRVECLGYWAGLLESRKWRKPWADTRIDQNVWLYEIREGSEKCTLDRQNRLRFTPKREAWIANDAAAATCTVPTGETIKRVTFSYAFAEGAQNYRVGFSTNEDGSLWTLSTSGTGNVDHTMATPRQTVRLYFQAQANQTPPSDGSVYGEFSNVTVYTETGAINLTEIADDVRGHVTELSTDTSLLDANALSLVPFISDTDSLADILMTAASYGDTSYNAWAAQVLESAKSSDGKPILAVEQQPLLTGYDYAIRLDEDNVEPGIEFIQDISTVRNWIAVQYRDAEGKTITITPDDNALLEDAASVTAYGERQEWLNLDTTSASVALSHGRRYLKQYKDPRWTASGDIVVRGQIRTAGSGIIPACRIRAGKRLRIENFLGSASTEGLTLLISGTSYDATSETCSISVGVPDGMAVRLARMERNKKP